MSQGLFLVAVSALLVVTLAALMILLGAVVDLVRSFEQPEEIPDPDVVRYLRPSGNVDRVEEEAGS